MSAAEPLSPVTIEAPQQELERIRSDMDPLIARADALTIATSEQWEAASEFLRDVKAMQKEIRDTMEPSVKSAHRTWQNLTALRKKWLDPVEKAERLVKGKMAHFVDEQERKQREEQKRREEEARRRAEEEKLERAAYLEAKGQTEEAERVLEEPEVAPAIWTPAVEKPKAEGIASRKVYRAEVVDFRALVTYALKHDRLDLLLPNDSLLSELARQQHHALKIPGVEVQAETVIASRERWSST